MMNDKDLYELSAEVDAISIMIMALSYQLDNEKSLRSSLFGVTCHLDRISEDLTAIDEHYSLVERVVDDKGCKTELLKILGKLSEKPVKRLYELAQYLYVRDEGGNDK